jgi:hypothetical protein
MKLSGKFNWIFPSVKIHDCFFFVAKKCKALDILAVHFGETNYEENFGIIIEVSLNIDVYEYNHAFYFRVTVRRDKFPYNKTN